MTTGALKLRALALECDSDFVEARKVWIEAAIEEATSLRGAEDAALYSGIGEVVACLACAYRPYTKEQLRSFVQTFMDRLGTRSGR